MEMMNVFKHRETLAALNAVGENLLVADKTFTIVWMNEAAKQLMEVVGKHVGIDQPDGFIGQSLVRFHSDKVVRILEHGPFPYRADITLFERYAASIVVDTLHSDEGEVTGYLLTWKDVTSYEEERRAERKRLEELYTPVIETANRMSLLIPLTGSLDRHRVEKMTEKVLKEVSRRNSRFVILDFTGITHVAGDDLDIQLARLTRALRLMGVETLYVGFPIEIVQSFVRNGLEITARSFPSFKEGIQYVWGKSGYRLQKK
ncbi:hypothetical protein JQN58_01190 [Aneurinibacillus sp. BA2021]|nr:hypothetical protein [Aneurinibacillus sp. BA2021]